jgi:hypothetical protein
MGGVESTTAWPRGVGRSRNMELDRKYNMWTEDWKGQIMEKKKKTENF